MGLIIVLILAGLLLMLAEILLIPGVGVAGILGVLSLGGSCYYAFDVFGNTTGLIVTSVNCVVLLLLLIYVLRAKTWKRLSLETNIDSKAIAEDKNIVAGMRGRSATRIAPMGTVRIDDRFLEAKAMEGMIDAGEEVEVVLVEDGKIYVMPVVRENQ